MLLFVSIIFVFVISPFAMAQIDFGVVSDSFYLSPGNFSLTLTSKMGETDRFGITVLGSQRNWVYFNKEYVTLYPGRKVDVNFIIEAPESASSGVYEIPILVYSLKNESLYSRKELNLLIEEEYKAELRKMETNKKTFKPGETIEIKGEIKNTGNEEFKEIDFSYELVKGEETLDSEKSVFSLEKNEEKRFEESFKVKTNLKPGEYEAKFYLTMGNKVLDKKNIKISVEKFGKIEKEIDSLWTPLGEFGKIWVENKGNIKKTEKITLEIKRPWDVFLTSSEESSKEYTDGIATYIWPVTLGVGEKMKISYQIHYWPLYVIFILVLYAGYWTFKTVRRPKVKKRAVNIKELEDDRKEIMVSLEIKNIGEKLKDVVVEDLVPPVAKLVKDFETIKPKIKEGDEGTRVTWNLKELDAHENRILTYKIKTLIGTLDYLKLPKATIKSKIGDRKIESNSNSLKIKEGK